MANDIGALGEKFGQAILTLVTGIINACLQTLGAGFWVIYNKLPVAGSNPISIQAFLMLCAIIPFFIGAKKFGYIG